MSRPVVVLLHGIGSDVHAWDRVHPLLEASLDVRPVTLAGHGGRRLPYGLPPSPAALALWVAEELAGLGVGEVHAAGHSLGGWVALELARAGRVASVTAVAPAGLWGPGGSPRRTRYQLRAARAAALVAAPLAPWLARSTIGRRLAFGLGVHRPQDLTPGEAAAIARALAVTDGFGAVLDMTRGAYLDATDVTVPCSVVFGDHDRLLPPGVAQHRGGVPSVARWVELPDVGHSPALERPDEVARLVLDTVAAGERADGSRPAADLAHYGFEPLPSQTRDDTAAGWGEAPGADEERLLADRPPHWG